MNQRPLTEAPSLYRDLEKMSTAEILQAMNNEDQKVAVAVSKVLDAVQKFVDHLTEKVSNGGRLFYIGAGTSGRLGIIDASECPPTFGVSPDLVIGIMAGGDRAIRKAVEFSEDDETSAWDELSRYFISQEDCIVGIAASGTTPFVVGGLKMCREHGITTACICSNPGSPVTQHADFPIAVELGPEFLTGSTRLKSGTAQKMILNMISTSLMINLGHVKGNKMVDMQLTNKKLVNRGIHMLCEAYGIHEDEAKKLLDQYGSVRAALERKS
ncbi:MAG: N-acetylmuramic acid 6-phosphate etherase [Saprospiraceae bacterium]|nr:N-acetylmuramic acid 6-phosphate etherase [Saprospiraceae bacterium]